MSHTTRRKFAKALAAGVALPVVAAEVFAQTQPAEDKPPAPLAIALADVLRAQYGQYLNDEELTQIRKDINDSIPALERFRGVKLVNSTEPDYSFVALAKRWE